MVWVRALRPVRRIACAAARSKHQCPPASSRASGRAFLSLALAAGVSGHLLRSGGHLLLEEEDDEDFAVHKWNLCQPAARGSGSRVFVWGNRACWPASEDQRSPDALRTPTEVPWFEHYALENNCKWEQLSFGPSFGVSRTDSGEIFLWGSATKNGKGRQFAPPRRLVFKEKTDARFHDVQCSESSAGGSVPMFVSSSCGALRPPEDPALPVLRARLEARAAAEEVSYEEAVELMLQAHQEQRPSKGSSAPGPRSVLRELFGSIAQFDGSHRAYALHCEGSTREAIFEAEACLGKRDMGLPFASALAFFHNQLGTVDQDAVRDMNVRASQELHHAPEAAKLLTVRFYTMVGETEKGQEVLGSMDDIDSAAANAVRGWNAFVAGKKVNAASGKTSNAFLEQPLGAWRGRCGQFFDAATGSGTELENLDALMGKAKVLEGKRQWAQALDCLNKVIVMHDWFLPALMEKAKTLMMTADWDQALEAAGRLQQQEPNNIEALRLNVLFLLSRESRCDAAAERLQELVAAMQQLEPHNYDLVLSCAQLFSRLAGRHKSILNITFSMMKRVTDAAPEQAKYLTELGYQYMMQAELSKAEQTFHSAVAKDETDVRALFGIINCRVQEGSLDDAEEQLEFLSEIQISVGKSPDLAFLQSLIAWRKRRDAEGALNLLNETLTLHITNFKSAVGYDFFIKLNADFMLEIAREYLQHTISGGDDAAKPGGYLLRGVQVLETLTRFVPGLVPAQVLLAKAKVALNEVDVATRILHQCLRLDPSCADTYLLLARIYHQKDQQNAALQYLEQGLSHDFSVRSHPLYYLVKAEVLSAAGEVDQASKLLEQAMALPGVKSDSKKSAVQLSQADRCSLFTLHVNLLTKLKQLDQASEVVKTAIAEFAGTPEEVKILVANSQLAIEKGEIDQALNMLRTMKPDHPQFAMAKAAMADIYLKHRKDKKAYARCYKAIVDHAPTVQNYLILGDALLSIQEPADAIIAFQQAMDIDSHKDPGLVRKIGKAMMQTHDYDRAIQYYHDALRKKSAQQQESCGKTWRSCTAGSSAGMMPFGSWRKLCRRSWKRASRPPSTGWRPWCSWRGSTATSRTPAPTWAAAPAPCPSAPSASAKRGIC
ncbi:unnamed protein product [Effrenium voratum]|uniref:Uncharacterized protein n=1 Tax=Effrenium voratum TaxID=2562239 RepID=A0AA36IUP0_9DINO|nr:unnamed protein product [Effrenium voratum]